MVPSCGRIKLQVQVEEMRFFHRVPGLTLWWVEILDNMRDPWSRKWAPPRPWFSIGKVCNVPFRWWGRPCSDFKYLGVLFMSNWVSSSSVAGTVLVSLQMKLSFYRSPVIYLYPILTYCHKLFFDWKNKVTTIWESRSRATALMNQEDPFEVVQAPYKDAPWSASTRAVSGTSYLTETMVQTQDPLESAARNRKNWTDLLSVFSPWPPPGKV